MGRLTPFTYMRVHRDTHRAIEDLKKQTGDKTFESFDAVLKRLIECEKQHQNQPIPIPEPIPQRTALDKVKDTLAGWFK